MSREEVRAEVLAAILFYEEQGWDWLDLVEFLCWRRDHAQD